MALRIEQAVGTSGDRVPRVVRVCGYVDVALGDVVEIFARPDIGDMLETTLRAALQDQDSCGPIMLRPAGLARTTRRTARLPLTWRAGGRPGRVSEGTASIQLITVQSGNEPKTEVLVSVGITDEVAGSIAARMHRFVDQLTHQLAHADVAVSPVGPVAYVTSSGEPSAGMGGERADHVLGGSRDRHRVTLPGRCQRLSGAG